MPPKKIIGICKIEGCERDIDSLGMCRLHYARQYYYGRTHLVNTGDKFCHPLYYVWFERKQRNALCVEWLDFWQFVKDVSPKPEGRYFLARLDWDKPYAADNFKWRFHLKKEKGESNKEWWARKWQERQKSESPPEKIRNLKKFGLTLEMYAEKFREQNGVCEICKQKETAIHGTTRTVKSLAVDHCHATGKIRDLLCGRCNTTLGRIKESIEILDAMKAYLIKHLSTT